LGYEVSYNTVKVEKTFNLFLSKKINKYDIILSSPHLLGTMVAMLHAAKSVLLLEVLYISCLNSKNLKHLLV
jgi:hypothetical protein